jgi:drug/metabolite transporter (DMT)-like permease
MIASLRTATGWLIQFPLLLLAFASLCWAGNTVAGRLAVAEISPMLLTWLRWSVVLAVLWPLHGAEVRAHWPDIKPKVRQIGLMAALGFTGFNALFYVAAYHTTAVNLGILQGAIPVFVLIGAFLAYGTRVSLLQILGVLTTTIGVLVVATRGAPAAAFAQGLNPGDLAMIVGSALYAYYAVGLQTRPAISGPAFFTLLVIFAALSAVPLVIIESLVQGWKTPSLQGLLVTLWVAIFPSCLAQLAFLRGVDAVGPGRAGVFINLVPVFAALFGVVLLGERFAGYHALSLVLVLGGIALAQRKPA